jgi:peptidyl-prolyl cis-trans isomerase C
MLMRVPLTSRRTRVLGRLVIGLVVVGAVGGLVAVRMQRLPEEAAFKIGDRVVSVAEVEERVDALQALYGVQPPEQGGQLDRFRRDSAKAVSIILDDAARRRGIVIAEKAARDVLTRLIEREFPDSGRAGFIQALGNSGASEGEVLDEIQRQLAVSRLFGDITKGVTVTDADVQVAFRQRRAQLGTPEQRWIRNIVVATRAEAAQVLRSLRSGEDVGSVARKLSLDGSTRGTGGDIGQVSAEQLDAGYAKVAFAARPHEGFGPVQTEHGWNVGVVESILPPKPAAFADVRDELGVQLQSERALDAWRSWLATQIKAAHVRYADTYKRPTRTRRRTSSPRHPLRTTALRLPYRGRSNDCSGPGVDGFRAAPVRLVGMAQRRHPRTIVAVSTGSGP